MVGVLYGAQQQRDETLVPQGAEVSFFLPFPFTKSFKGEETSQCCLQQKTIQENKITSHCICNVSLYKYDIHPHVPSK